MQTTKGHLATILTSIAQNSENTQEIREKALQMSAILHDKAQADYIDGIGCEEYETINTCDSVDIIEEKTAKDGRTFVRCKCGASGFIKASDGKRPANHVNKLKQLNNGRCEICQRLESESGKFFVHHIIPYKFGGKSTVYNMQVVCHECHVMIHRQRNTLNNDRNYSDPIGGKFNSGEK